VGSQELILISEWRIPLYKIFTDENDVRLVARVIERGTYWAIGPEIQEFEKSVSDYLGAKYAVAFNSGTSALHAIMIAAGIKPGEEVVVPSFTFIATANSSLFVRACPVFADIEEETYGLDPESVARKITEKTKAIVPVHIGGLTCKAITELKEIAEKRNILLIEDACESLGSTAYGKKAGTFGDVAVLSFCGNKIITTGEGGIVVTNSGEICEKLKLVRSHGRLEKEPYFLTTRSLDYIELGYNWRMPTLIAALGVSQMMKLETVIEKRRSIAERMSAELAKIDEIEVPMQPLGFRHVYQMYTIKVKTGKNRRDELRAFLTKKRIITKIFFEPIHLTYFYRTVFGHKENELPVTEQIANTVLTLPIYPTLSTGELNYVIDSVKEFFEK
jgi:perosamine synthetase